MLLCGTYKYSSILLVKVYKVPTINECLLHTYRQSIWAQGVTMVLYSLKKWSHISHSQLISSNNSGVNMLVCSVNCSELIHCAIRMDVV